MLAAASTWILLQVFANGCTAMTGVEAVSNGVRAFREPTVKNAQRTLTVIIGLLIVMLAGIAYLVRVYGIAATDPGQAGYQSVLSMLVAAVAGRGWFYYVTDRLGAGDSVAFGEHRLRRFPAAVQGGRAEQFSAALFRLSRAPAGLLAGHHRAGLCSRPYCWSYSAESPTA